MKFTVIDDGIMLNLKDDEVMIHYNDNNVYLDEETKRITAQIATHYNIKYSPPDLGIQRRQYKYYTEAVFEAKIIQNHIIFTTHQIKVSKEQGAPPYIGQILVYHIDTKDVYDVFVPSPRICATYKIFDIHQDYLLYYETKSNVLYVYNFATQTMIDTLHIRGNIKQAKFINNIDIPYIKTKYNQSIINYYSLTKNCEEECLTIQEEMLNILCVRTKNERYIINIFPLMDEETTQKGMLN